MGRTFQVEVEVPKGLKAGDRFAIDVAVPAAPKIKKTKLTDIPLKKMTIEQLKRERINARSVLYKATRRDDRESIEKATIRLNKVAAELAARQGTTLYEEVNAPLGLFEDETTA